MEDEELSRIRQQRMAQLQAAKGQRPMGGPANRSGTGNQEEQKQQQQQAKEKEEEMRNNLLSAVLTQEARARLATIAAAKPDRAKMVEDIIIQHTRMGMIRGKVDENSLKDLLEKVTSQTKRETKVSYERRRVFDDSDEDDDD
uniref:Programmed cell death protein 5 n=1 Tax=Aceria tosichella TaxID=561515 RepID=A0A6G1SJ70_9ACAR